jgi:hypothetical protein
MSKQDTNALLTATRETPVTTKSLEALDLDRIQSNINLRIDINYDHELYFRPTSGKEVEHKRIEAYKYWLSLEVELRILYQHNLLPDCAGCMANHPSVVEEAYFQPRLLQMFRSLKELLIILVPESDQDQIAEYLDISLMLQELSHGLLDISRLAAWLCELLTSHCAPMRDDAAQEMATRITTGAGNGDMKELVTGIEKLFSFLEAMKLDACNHQLRSFRYQLIEQTVAFQQDHFSECLELQNLRLVESRQWYVVAEQHHRFCNAGGRLPKASTLQSLVHGMAEFCSIAGGPFPGAFRHDRTRLQILRDKLQDIIHATFACLCLTN